MLLLQIARLESDIEVASGVGAHGGLDGHVVDPRLEVGYGVSGVSRGAQRYESEERGNKRQGHPESTCGRSGMRAEIALGQS